MCATVVGADATQRSAEPTETPCSERRSWVLVRLGSATPGDRCGMTHSPALDKPGVRLMLNKVPEVTLWFWIIKILCTTVGESFADWINMTLGVGLVDTALLFTVIFAV